MTCMASCGHDAGCGRGFDLFGFFPPFINNKDSLLQNILLRGEKGREGILFLLCPLWLKGSLKFPKTFFEYPGSA